MGFLKPFIPYPSLLDPKPGDPLGYVTNDGMWAAVWFAGTGKKPKGYIIIHNGCPVKTPKRINNLLILSTTNGKPLKEVTQMTDQKHEKRKDALGLFL